VSTVDCMSYMYGTVIWVPSTTPVDVWSCDYRCWYMASCQLYFAVNSRHTGLNMKQYCINYYVQMCCCCGQCMLTIPMCMVATITHNGGVVVLLIWLDVTRNGGSVANQESM
jgi:hypothetical protein